MSVLEVFLRISTLLLLIIRIPYWPICRRKADVEKPKTQIFTLRNKFSRYLLYGAWAFLGLQLLGLDLFAFPHNISIQIFGFILTVIGVMVSIQGRHKLGTNWTHAGETQIKKDHDLITTGIYRFIRHPIYSGVFISYIGGELVSESGLVFFFFVVIFYMAYKQGKVEEKLLLKHFGKKYEDYIKKTKMFIPYVI